MYTKRKYLILLYDKISSLTMAFSDDTVFVEKRTKTAA